jgi:hypothetical protein
MTGYVVNFMYIRVVAVHVYCKMNVWCCASSHVIASQRIGTIKLPSHADVDVTIKKFLTSSLHASVP